MVVKGVPKRELGFGPRVGGSWARKPVCVEDFTLYTDAEEITDVSPVSKLTGHSR